MDYNPLYFTINNTKFLQCGIYRDKHSGKFDIVKIKNCNTNTYKNIRYSKLKEILKNNYVNV